MNRSAFAVPAALALCIVTSGCVSATGAGTGEEDLQGLASDTTPTLYVPVGDYGQLPVHIITRFRIGISANRLSALFVPEANFPSLGCEVAGFCEQKREILNTRIDTSQGPREGIRQIEELFNRVSEAEQRDAQRPQHISTRQKMSEVGLPLEKASLVLAVAKYNRDGSISGFATNPKPAIFRNEELIQDPTSREWVVDPNHCRVRREDSIDKTPIETPIVFKGGYRNDKPFPQLANAHREVDRVSTRVEMVCWKPTPTPFGQKAPVRLNQKNITIAKLPVVTQQVEQDLPLALEPGLRLGLSLTPDNKVRPHIIYLVDDIRRN